MINFLLFAIVNILLCLAVSPFLMTLIKKVKAFMQGRKGPPFMQGYFNLLKLLKKEVVYSSNSSAIMRITPYINMATMLLAVLFVPLVFIPGPFGGIGNIILFLYLLAMAKFFMALAGLDAASTFGGMGSSREMSLSAVIEPITIIVFATLAFLLKSLNLHEMFAITSSNAFFMDPAIILVSISLFIVLIVETARVPVDNPETHLELTMVHEAMILEASGKNLAMMELSHAMKQTLLMAIIINLIFPFGLSQSLSLFSLAFSSILFLVKASVLAIAIGIFESLNAKMRLFRLPILFMIAFFLSIVTILLEVF